MSKLNLLRAKFNQLEKELNIVKDSSLYTTKKEELLDVYAEIQNLEAKTLMWSTSASY